MNVTRMILFALVLAACGSTDADPAPTEAAAETTTTDAPAETTQPPSVDEGCAHVIDATITAGASGYSIDATVRSADTGWEKYADAWEVRGPNGEVYGERVLTHPHENEQPFTRSLTGVEIPDGVDEVTIAARDSVVGYCGDVFTVAVPSS